MKIKGIKINKQSQVLVIAVEEIFRMVFKFCFALSFFCLPFGLYKIFELVIKFINNIKPLIEGLK